MFKGKKNIKLVCSLAFLMFASGVAGCGTGDKKYYKFQPTFQDRAVARTLANDKEVKEGEVFIVNGMKVKVEKRNILFVDYDVSIPIADIKVSDADVLGFSSDIQKALRHRMDRARRVRLGSGSLQVIAAATGATLGLVTGDVTTAAVFAAISAVMPELQHIFQARERSDAYERGLELIQDADTRYYNKRTENAIVNTITTSELTKEGAALLSEIAACLKLVDKALLQTIPTIEDLKAATGRVKEDLSKITVVPKNLSLDIGGAHTIHVIDSYAITFSVDKAGIIEVKNPEGFKDIGTNIIKIEGIGTGTAHFKLFNRQGNDAEVEITVGRENKKPTANAGEDKTVKVGETVELDGSKSTDPEGGNLIYKWEVKSPASSFAKIEKQEKKTTFISDKPGEYVIKLVVNDGHTDSDPDEVKINAHSQNTKPTAKTKVDKTDVNVGDTVKLDGSESSDPDKDELNYKWEFSKKPEGSSAKIEKQEKKTIFTADKPGAYVVKLTVNDGQEDSDLSEVLINAKQ